MFYLQMFLMGFGVYATFLWAYNTFLESLLGIVWGTIKGWFSNKPLTEKYGPWAVITGATDGIGKRYAEILASKGMNIMLLSRSEPKLMKVAHEISESYNVQTRWVAVDFSKGPEIYQMIREQVEGLDIGILVITGATDGIGKRYGEILASKGMNIVLISRSEPKLMKVANEIYERYNVQTRWVAVDFSRGPEIYKMIKEQIEGLDIGILVNNVGYYPTVRTFDLNSDDEIISTININILSTSMMSRIVLPGMKYRKRGIIVNISSTSCYRPAAYLNMYASAKAFVTNFSLALNHELRGSGVECQVVTPGMVHTNMIKKFEGDVPWYISITTSDSLASFGVFTLGKTSHTTGGWMHAFQVSWQDLLPLSLGTFFISLITKKAVGK